MANREPQNNKDYYAKELYFARMRLLQSQGFFGLILMHSKFGLDMNAGTAYTDGNHIMFDPTFMDELNHDQLDFILMHEVMHIVLKHCFRGQEADSYLFNVACDIVVNSNIFKSLNIKPENFKVCGETPMHLTPNKQEGYHYTAEEVYMMLVDKMKNSRNKKSGDQSQAGESGSGSGTYGSTTDNHDHWGDQSLSPLEQAELNRHIAEAAEVALKAHQLPPAVERMIEELKEPQLDWHRYIHEFIQSDACDYTFNPPDRRENGDGFIMPDFNDFDKDPEPVWFIVDTSGSINNEMLTEAFSEIKGAIDQFDGKLKGYIGFFDEAVHNLTPFDETKDILTIKPKGGGGTDVRCVYQYIKENFKEEDFPKNLIILTDGETPFPQEDDMLDIPSLYVINGPIDHIPNYIKCVEYK